MGRFVSRSVGRRVLQVSDAVELEVVMLLLVLSSVVGGVLLLIALRDVFHQVFHPEGQGSLGSFVLRGMLRVARRLGIPLTVVGPLGLLATLAAWLAMTVVGWGLVLLPHVPADVLYAGKVPIRDSLLDSLYLASVTVATLGYGDIVPTSPVLRVLAPLQAFMGFAIMTAGLTWILSTYPPLVRQRTLARQAWELVEHEPPAPEWLRAATSGIITSTIDIRQFSAVFYFHTSDTMSALPFQTGRLLQRARELQGGGGELDVEAGRLERALDSYADALRDRYLRVAERATTEQVLQAYRETWDPR